MELLYSIALTEKLIALALIFQTIELFLIRDAYSDSGVWRWADLNKEFKIFSRINQAMLCFFLNYKNFILFLGLRLVLAICLLFYSSPLILCTLLFSTIMIALRWRGTFNGGSDYMTVLVLSALSVASIYKDSETVQLAALWYITIQVVSSYFIAGLVKVRRGNWRDGSALQGFVASTIYKDISLTKLISSNKTVALLFSWTIIIFELAFIFTLLSPSVAVTFILIAFLFHVGNFYVFGLNRFIFSWMACYPALVFCSGW